MTKSHWKKSAERFRVWLRPMGGSCSVRVDGISNAQWLLKRLSTPAITQSVKSINGVEGSSICTFQIECPPPMECADIEDLLKSIPEVQLMSEQE